MCGRYRRRSDKQRIAELFAASADLEELYFGPEDLRLAHAASHSNRQQKVSGRSRS
jgi:hypothetical protein